MNNIYNITSSDILRCLKNKHSSDTFVPECKIGMTNIGCLRFDAWVMRNSWVNAECIGYEIKVNRNDFLNDKKYRGYLPYCNSFYFVCPTGLINPKEIDDEIGLFWLSKTGNILYQKKKAIFRNIIIPDDIFRYILMARSQITKEHNFSIESNKEFF